METSSEPSPEQTPSAKKEVSTSTEIKDLFAEVIGWESKLLKTVKLLTLQPGLAIRNHCLKLMPLISPVAYYLMVEGFLFLLVSFTGYTDFIESSTGIKENETGFKILSFLKNEQLRHALILPFLIGIQWLLFRKFNSSIKENAFFIFFKNAHFNLLFFPISLSYWLLTNQLLPSAVHEIVPVLYASWVAIDFYKISPAQAILRSVGAALVFFLVFMTIATLSVLLLDLFR